MWFFFLSSLACLYGVMYWTILKYWPKVPICFGKSSCYIVRKNKGPFQHRIKAQRREDKTDAESRCLYFAPSSWQGRIVRQIFLWRSFLGTVPRKNQLENGEYEREGKETSQGYVVAVPRRNILQSMSHRTVPIRKEAARVFMLSPLIKTGPEAKRIPRYSIFGRCRQSNSTGKLAFPSSFFQM